MLIYVINTLFLLLILEYYYTFGCLFMNTNANFNVKQNVNSDVNLDVKSAANLSIITEITIKKWLILVNLRQKKKKATENGTKTSSETTFDTRSRFSAKRLLRGVSSSTLPVSTK